MSTHVQHYVVYIYIYYSYQNKLGRNIHKSLFKSDVYHWEAVLFYGFMHGKYQRGGRGRRPWSPLVLARWFSGCEHRSVRTLFPSLGVTVWKNVPKEIGQLLRAVLCQNARATRPPSQFSRLWVSAQAHVAHKGSWSERRHANQLKHITTMTTSTITLANEYKLHSQ